METARTMIPKSLRRAFTRGRKKKPSIRDRFQVGRGTYGEPKVLHWGEPATLKVGAFCSIADGVTIFLGGEHRTDWVTTHPFMAFRASARGIAGHPQTRGDVVIGNDVWVGQGAAILSGVSVGDGAVIAAFSVVRHDVPAYGIVAGNPARLVRRRFSDPIVARLERVAWWNWPDALIDEAMPLLLSSDIEAFLAFAEKARPPSAGAAP